VLPSCKRHCRNVKSSGARSNLRIGWSHQRRPGNLAFSVTCCGIARESEMARLRRFLVSWVAAVALAMVVPVCMLFGIALRGFVDLEDWALFGRAFGIPALGATAAGAAFGLRQWWMGSALLIGAVLLAAWAFGGIHGKGRMVILMAAANSFLAAGAAVVIAWRRFSTGSSSPNDRVAADRGQ
jgi:hypothetical protein